MLVRTGTKIINCNRVLQPQSTNFSPKSVNANRSCEKCKSNHSLAVCPEYQLCPPSERYSIVSKNSLCTNCLSTNYHKQTCPSTKRCQVCSGFHHTTLLDPAKKSIVQQQLFQQKTHKNINLLFRQTTRQWLKIRSRILRQNVCRIRIQTAATGKTKPTLKRQNLNGSSTNQSFSINQSPDAPKNWYEQLQLIPVSFLKEKKKPSMHMP